MTEQLSTDIKRQKKATPSECKICTGPALYANFGVISCESCKIFFRRNAQQALEALKCVFDGHCEINTNTRHACKSCRLKKCFARGMQAHMIRGRRSKTKKKSVQTTSKVLVRLNESEQLPVLNLLRSDQSTFTIDEWNLLSNLIHCYDEHSGLLAGMHYMREQYKLPLKSRFKSASLIELLRMSLNAVQLLYKNNQDFLSLSIDDRSILLHKNIKHTSGVSANFIFYHSGLVNSSAYYNGLSLITNANVRSCAQRIADRIHFDTDIIKLFLAILSFSTVNYTVYSNSSSVNFSNIKEILRIQDLYINLTWRYLLYKYKYEQSVIIFSNLIRCLFSIHDGIVKAEDVEWYTNSIYSLAQQTERTHILNN